jgi:hypothetical protein
MSQKTESPPAPSKAAKPTNRPDAGRTEIGGNFSTMNAKSADLWNRANESLESLKDLSRMFIETKRLTRGQKALSLVLRSEVMGLAATLRQIQIAEQHT